MLGLKSIKYFYRHVVKKVAIQFNEGKKTTYRWRARYDGSIGILKDKSIRPHTYLNQHTEEIRMIRDYKETGLVVLWVKTKEAGYTRTIHGLYYVLQKLGIYEKASSKVNEKEQKKYKQHIQEKKYKYC